MILGVCDSYHISLACQTLPESQKFRCGFNLMVQVVMKSVIFMISLGSSKLATGAAHEQLGAAKEPSESPSSPGEAQKQPRRAQEHSKV